MSIVATLGFISLSLTGFPGNARDWAGVFPTNDTSNIPVSWVYIACGNQTCRDAKSTKGTISLQIPKVNGEYEIRFLTASGVNTYKIIENSPRIGLTVKN